MGQGTGVPDPERQYNFGRQIHGLFNKISVGSCSNLRAEGPFQSNKVATICLNLVRK